MVSKENKQLQDLQNIQSTLDEKIKFIEDNATDSTGKKIKDLKVK